MSDDDLKAHERELTERLDAFFVHLAERTNELLPAGDRTDAHIHLGIDAGSGMEMTLGAIEQQLDVAGVQHGALIPLNQSDGYHVTNGRLAELSARSDGRFRHYYRVEPRDPDLEAHVSEGLAAGAVGLKLHPRGDEFSVLDERVQEAVALCAEQHKLVLIHCGMDMDGATAEAVELARRHPDAWILFGHLAADSLAKTAEAMSELPNALMCTGWWGSVDMGWAAAWVDHRRFIFGSDPPYGSVPLGAFVTGATFAAAGLDDDALAGVFGGNFDAARANAHDLSGPARTCRPEDANLLARIPAGFQRAYVSLEGGGGLAEQGNELATRYLELARCSLEPGTIDGLQDEADEIADTIALAIDLNKAGLDQECYRAIAAAMAQTACLPVLARR